MHSIIAHLKKKIINIFFFRLSGSEHSVATGISIHYKCGTEYKEKLCAELTKVRMTVLTDNVIDKYVETGEPL